MRHFVISPADLRNCSIEPSAYLALAAPEIAGAFSVPLGWILYQALLRIRLAYASILDEVVEAAGPFVRGNTVPSELHALHHSQSTSLYFTFVVTLQ